MDEAGTPFCVTVDFDTLEGDGSVTLRERDSTEQRRAHPRPNCLHHPAQTACLHPRPNFLSLALALAPNPYQARLDPP